MLLHKLWPRPLHQEMLQQPLRLLLAPLPPEEPSPTLLLLPLQVPLMVLPTQPFARL